MRGHFGTVLNYRYNPAHRDHLHLDDLSATGFVPEHRSRVLFLQMVLTYLFDQRVAIDGLIGPETRGAAQELLEKLDLTGGRRLSRPQTLYDQLDTAWPDLLDAVIQRGFARVEPGEEGPDEPEATPLTLLQRVYRTIGEELGGTAARAPVEAAVRSFAQHEDTARWLDQFREEEKQETPVEG